MAVEAKAGGLQHERSVPTRRQNDVKLSFKAQSQARASAEALNGIIDLRTTAFVKNVGHNQQVNIALAWKKRKCAKRTVGSD
jgi:hypothetical protein